MHGKRNNAEENAATVIFDFDGTIADSMQLLFSIYNALARTFGCRTISEEEREKLRGLRPQEIFCEYGMTLAKMARFAIRIRREIAIRIPEVKLFDGMAELLQQLSNDGFRLGIISSNAEANLHSFLNANDLSPLFDFVWSGKNLFGKERVIRKCIRRKKLLPDRVIYVGDETRDVEAVRKVGIPMVAVTWGYSAAEALRKMEPEILVDTPEALCSWIRDWGGIA